MGLNEQEPTDEQRHQYDQVNTLGDVKVEEFSALEDKLADTEELELITGVVMDGDGKSFLIVTDRRLITYHSKRFSLLGEQSEFKDIALHSIKEMKVEDRKEFDILKVKTKRKEEKIMLPDGAGIKVAGKVRELQEAGDPIKDLDRLSEQLDEGNITQEEYQNKKKELLDRV
ncbi:MAG: hypothetical protein SVU32_02385 [Candidatus Nanohaloarchaea archaeon]|nr:hypothetical protein [Candidatus Nanohaloarchaea archaeon]